MSRRWWWSPACSVSASSPFRSRGLSAISRYVGSVILISSSDRYEDDDYADLMAGSPAVGFLSKATLSADAISRLVR